MKMRNRPLGRNCRRTLLTPSSFGFGFLISPKKKKVKIGSAQKPGPGLRVDQLMVKKSQAIILFLQDTAYNACP
jgi:hypothetical protein